MRKEEKKRPTIRFEGFSDDWEQRKFGEIADYKKGPFGSSLKKEIFVPEGPATVKIYEQQNAINKDWHLSRYFITSEYANRLSNFKTHAGDIIVSCAGTIGEIYELPKDSEPGIINQALMRVRVNKTLVTNDLYKILFENMIGEFSEKRSNGSAIKNIPPLADLKPMATYIPSKDEQGCVGNFFGNLDHLITLHQRKLDQVKTLKKYFLQNMFPAEGETVPKIRFKGFTDDWEQRKLEELATVKDSARISNEFWETDGIPYIRASDLTNGNLKGILFLARDTFKYYKDKTGAPEKGDVLFNGGGEIGKAVLKKDDADIYVQGGAVLYVQTAKSQYLTGQYLTTYFQSTRAKRYIDLAQTGGTMKHFTLKPAQVMPVIYPTLNEQRQIGVYFQKLDNRITLHQRKVDQLQTLKKFMLQNLFV